MTMTATLLQPYQERISAALTKTIQEMGPDSPLKKACAYVLGSAGKRLRPAIVLMIQDTLGKGFDAMPSALAIEFFHSASLIADDLPCMDDDDFRRDQPAAHKAYGEAIALLASYGLIAGGYGLLAENQKLVENDVLTLALENASFNGGLSGATGGQFFDLVPPDKSEETLRRIIHMKTTSFFESAFVFGWLFGGGNPDELPLVKKAASHFGLAFQILDDLDDFERDSREGGLNLAVALGKEKAREVYESEASLFEEALRELNLFEGDLRFLIQI